MEETELSRHGLFLPLFISGIEGDFSNDAIP
jgi:hypothetical protein